MTGLPGEGYSYALDNAVTKLGLYQWKDPLPFNGPQPEAPLYPLAALGRFAEAAKVITDQVQAPAPIVAQSILAAASLVAQPHIDVEIDGREFPVSLYLITWLHQVSERLLLTKSSWLQ